MTSLVRNREFRAIAVTELLSVLGDQLSRVALALLVFGRTGSAGLGGLTYALTYLPTVAGGFLLSPVADRRPRREILIAIDTVRAVAVLAMAIPGTPLAMLCVLVAVSAFLSGPYHAARLAMLREILPREQYGPGMAVRQSLNQGATLAGFASGGFLATAFEPTTCLIIDGVTFALSAVVLLLFVRHRPAALPSGRPAAMTTTLRLVWRSPAMRAVFLMTFSALFLIAPEALAAPLAAEMSVSPRWVGLFMASAGLFSVVFLALLARFVTAAHYAKAFPVACVVPGVPLPAVAAVDDPYLILLVFGLSGAMWAVLIVISVSLFAELLPDDQRARGMGIAASTNLTAHGIGAAVAGLVAERIGAGVAISVLGLAGLVFAIPPIVLWRRAVSGRVARASYTQVSAER
ncbi:MFS transporter [Actinoplanes lobatus]|uniref:MFS family permease n=1 Tax=Actinoplanes lobatus TaxID=113568 RepID=A0A7W7HJA2_9ACTN|nr:MFS transporter [Actinoplanes lobatus]MBB4751207.1 MFS family permease [Actinoplanes lobatus]GGN95820.1 MFS transporter [Actinoplanes lobatus]GIE44260.1 MFS transporter [Actinoplanes lobatus]